MKTASFQYTGPGRVVISRTMPEGLDLPTYAPLFPGKWPQPLPYDEFAKRYHNEILFPLDARDTFRAIEALAGGYEPVLICRAPYNRPGQRRIVAAWFYHTLNRVVGEIPPGAEYLPVIKPAIPNDEEEEDE